MDSSIERQRTTTYLCTRNAHSHAAFFLPHIRSGSRILDCGCGPGSITRELGRLVSGATVIGIDSDEEQLAVAQSHGGAEFIQGSVYELPFENASFDAVLAHAVFQHLAEPDRCLAELYRVIAPGGVVGVRSPDWSGLLMYPDPPPVRDALTRFIARHYRIGNPFVGRALPVQFRQAGFEDVQFSATFECSVDPAAQGLDFAGYMASRGDLDAAEVFAGWAAGERLVFAQAWCEVVGFRDRAEFGDALGNAQPK